MPVGAPEGEGEVIISQEYLKECFDYDPETGELTWKRRPREHFRTEVGWKTFNGKYVSTKAGATSMPNSAHPVRIVSIHYNGGVVSYPEHRVIYHWFYGSVIIGTQVDHKDLNPLNNRIENLRLSTPSQNNGNTRRKSYLGKTRELPKGCYRQPWPSTRFQAKIKINYKTYCLGTYDTPEEASALYETSEGRMGRIRPSRLVSPSTNNMAKDMPQSSSEL